MIRSIGFGGGGMKGILHLGALKELSNRQPLYFPDGVYGCSIGSIVATCIAFKIPLESILEYVRINHKIDTIIPKFKLEHLSNVLTSKGLFDMDVFELFVSDLFYKHDIDIKYMKLSNAHMPLYIAASNITKGVPTIFSKEVFVLDALKASCCIPGLFKPYLLYNNLYIDGNHLIPCISKVMPKTETSLALSLETGLKHKITSKTFEDISPFEYLESLYSTLSHQLFNAYKDERTLCMHYPNLKNISDLSMFDLEDILKSSGQQLDRFLTTKMFNQKLSK